MIISQSNSLKVSYPGEFGGFSSTHTRTRTYVLVQWKCIESAIKLINVMISSGEGRVGKGREGKDIMKCIPSDVLALSQSTKKNKKQKKDNRKVGSHALSRVLEEGPKRPLFIPRKTNL